MCCKTQGLGLPGLILQERPDETVCSGWVTLHKPSVASTRHTKLASTCLPGVEQWPSRTLWQAPAGLPGNQSFGFPGGSGGLAAGGSGADGVGVGVHLEVFSKPSWEQCLTKSFLPLSTFKVTVGLSWTGTWAISQVVWKDPNVLKKDLGLSLGDVAAQGTLGTSCVALPPPLPSGDGTYQRGFGHQWSPRSKVPSPSFSLHSAPPPDGWLMYRLLKRGAP